MKKVVLGLMIALVGGSLGTAEAQEQQVKYFSRSGAKEVAAAEAHFFEVTEEDASGGGTKTRYQVADSLKVSRYTYSNLYGGEYKMGVLEGPFHEWYKNGKLKYERNYSNDKLHGEHKGWHENGQLWFTSMYSEGQYQDTLKGYFDTGKLRRVEVYDSGKLQSGVVYNEAGEEVKFFPMEQMPQFPGGEQAMLRWLGSNIKYPKSMRKAGVRGLVVVAFTVSRDGSLSELEVVKSLHTEGDAETLRVVKSMPIWKPGLQDGEPVAVRYVLPIRYSIN